MFVCFMVIQCMCFWRCCLANLCAIHSILKSCFSFACVLCLITCCLRNSSLVLVFYGLSHRSGVIGTGMYLNLLVVFAQLGLSCIILNSHLTVSLCMSLKFGEILYFSLHVSSLKSLKSFWWKSLLWIVTKMSRLNLICLHVSSLKSRSCFDENLYYE